MNLKYKLSALTTLTLLITGCASKYQYSPTPASAELLVIGNTEHFFVDAYKNENCDPSDHGQRLASFHGPIKDVKNHNEGKLVSIPTDEKFIFTAHYIDEKFALNRTCSKTAAFTPLPGKTYVAMFHVNEDITQCDYSVGVVTKNGEIVDEETAYFPHNLCLQGENKGPRNGKAGRVIWDVELFKHGLREITITTKEKLL